MLEVKCKFKPTEYVDIQTLLCEGDETPEKAITRIIKEDIVAKRLLLDLKYRGSSNE